MGGLDALEAELDIDKDAIDLQVKRWDKEQTTVAQVEDQITRWKSGAAPDPQHKIRDKLKLYEAALPGLRALVEGGRQWAAQAKQNQASAKKEEQTPAGKGSANPFARGSASTKGPAQGGFRRSAGGLERSGSGGSGSWPTPPDSSGGAAPPSAAALQQAAGQQSNLGKRKAGPAPASAAAARRTVHKPWEGQGERLAERPEGAFYSSGTKDSRAARLATRASPAEHPAPGDAPWQAACGQRQAAARDPPAGEAAQRRLSRAVTRTAAARANQDPIDISSDEEVQAVAARPASGNEPAAEPSRRTTRHTAYRSTSARFEGLRALYPPGGGPDCVQLLPGDLASLDPDEFLNDTIIDFALKRLQVLMEEAEPGSTQRLHFFSSFFYKKLTEKSGDAARGDAKHRDNHERVRKWTKGRDIFAADFLFVPIHDHLHWSLLVVCFPAAAAQPEARKPLLLHLDSMDGGHSLNVATNALRGYLQNEWRCKAAEPGSVAWHWRRAHPGAEWPGFAAAQLPARRPGHLPRQDNHCDCGLFVLTYAHYLAFARPPRLDADRLRELGRPCLAPGGDGYPLLLSPKWFAKGNAGRLRAHLRHAALELLAAQAPDPGCPAALQAVVERDELLAAACKYEAPEARLAANARELLRMRRAAKAPAEPPPLQAHAPERPPAAAQPSRKELADRAAAAAEARRQAGQGGSDSQAAPASGSVVCVSPAGAAPAAEQAGAGARRGSTHTRFDVAALPTRLAARFRLDCRQGGGGGGEAWIVTCVGGAGASAAVEPPFREFRSEALAMDFMWRDVSGKEGEEAVPLDSCESPAPQPRSRKRGRGAAVVQDSDSEGGAAQPPATQQPSEAASPPRGFLASLTSLAGGSGLALQPSPPEAAPRGAAELAAAAAAPASPETATAPAAEEPFGWALAGGADDPPVRNYFPSLDPVLTRCARTPPGLAPPAGGAGRPEPGGSGAGLDTRSLSVKLKGHIRQHNRHKEPA